jgi:hypothetical protein
VKRGGIALIALDRLVPVLGLIRLGVICAGSKHQEYSRRELQQIQLADMGIAKQRA